MTIEQLAQKLAQFESTHEKPEIIRECLNFCIGYLSDLSLVVKHYEKDGVPSVVIQTKDTLNVDVLFLGHVDTVPGKAELFEGRIDDEKLYGRGTLDMKAFVATSLVAFRELVESGYAGNLALAIVSDEELGGNFGAKYLVEEVGYKADTVLVPDDGEGIERLVQFSKHIMRLDFTATGKESHAARPWNGDNAIIKLFKTYQKLEKQVGRYETTPENMWVNTVSLGEIGGGVASNEVPEHATMTVDLRFTPDTTTKGEVLGWIENSLEPGVTYEIGMEGYPTSLDKDDEKVKGYVKSIEKILQNPVVYARHGGGTDGRYFAAKGMRTIVHQGTGADCQSDNEHVEIASLRQLVDIQKDFIVNNY